MLTPSEDFSTIPDSAWTLYEIDGPYRRYICHLDDKRSVIKTELIANDELIKQNQDDLFESQTKRFGDGKVVARIPLNVLYDPKTQLIEKLQQGDKDHMRWFLNSDHAKPWRSFRGKV